jgi:hypothetical protein
MKQYLPLILLCIGISLICYGRSGHEWYHSASYVIGIVITVLISMEILY